jgi:hypothetical protein
MTASFRQIVADPDDPLVGTTGITSYPVEEVACMIFVFVREDDFPLEDVPPLSSDLPIRFPENSEKFPHPLWPAAPSLMDEGAVALGMHRTGQSNWRIACENGFDNAHILVHMDNTIVHALNWVLPLGILPNHEEPITLIEDEDGPKGMMQWLFTDRWKPVLENRPRPQDRCAQWPLLPHLGGHAGRADGRELARGAYRPVRMVRANHRRHVRILGSHGEGVPDRQGEGRVQAPLRSCVPADVPARLQRLRSLCA